MCGICGEIRFDGTPPSLKIIHQMMDKLVNRGPDDDGDYAQGVVAFGQRRLSIIDLSARSHQPMVDTELDLVLVFNGTIYNYKELRKALIQDGYQFFSDGDTEVILKAYAKWGEACVDHLHGMFAFAIWDNKRQQLFLARDRLGIKPFYYVKTNRYLRFASNPQALLAVGDVDTTIDKIALHHHFTLHAVVPAPRTILKGIKKLGPGHRMTIKPTGQITDTRYWHLKATRPTKPMHELVWMDAIHEALRSAVKRRKVIADVPVGVLLSGGLDSSLLVALLAEAGVGDLRTFSIGFEDIGQERGSEFEYSDLVAQQYATQHQKIHISNADVLPRLSEAVAHMAEPMVAQDAVAFYLLSEQVSKSVKVVQSGQGADEVFAGYFWYPQMQAAQGTPLERFAKHYFDRDHTEFLQMVTAEYAGEDYTSSLVTELLAQPDAETFLDQVLRMDVTTLIVDDPVKRVDNMTMAWGLEARVPFLDHELVELAAQMPPELKLKSHGKHPLKAISRGLIPDAVIDRTKGYFPMPALKYVRGDFLKFMKEVLYSKTCIDRGLYNRNYVDKLVSNPEAYLTRIQGSKLWHLALLEHWLQVNVDKH